MGSNNKTIFYDPSKLVDRIGKILTPILLAVIALIVIKATMTPIIPHPSYESSPLFKGFLEDYKALDALASIIFGIVVVTAV